MTIRFRTIAPVLVAALAVFALAEDSFVLKRSPKVGDVVKLKLKAELEVQGQQASVTAISVDKITKVEANGDFTTEASQTETKVVFGGNEMAQPDQPPSVTVTKANGEILSIVAPQKDENSFRLSNLLAIRYPDKALKVGDTWDIEIKADAKTGAVAAKGTYKVEALEKIGAYDTARIKGSFKETSGTEPAGAETTSWISVKDGSMVKQEGSFTNAPFPAPVGPVTMKASLTRVD